MSKTYIQEIQQQIDEVISLDTESAAKRIDLGTINFEALMPVLRAAKELAAQLKQCDLSRLPDNRPGDLSARLKDIITQQKAVISFKLDDGNPTENRNNIQNEFRNAYRNLFDLSAPLISVLRTSSGDDERSVLRQKVSEVEKAQGEFISKQNDALAESRQVLEAIRKVSAEAGVSREARHFSEAATDHSRASTKWAIATGFFGTLAVIWGGIILWVMPIQADATPAQIVQQVLGKVVVFTGLYYALIWCARNYSANRHNYVVNKHKENSLSTFESFVKAAADDGAIKNAVLLQATTSIFASQVSGYAAKEAESESPNKIVEIMRSITTEKAAPH